MVVVVRPVLPVLVGMGVGVSRVRGRGWGGGGTSVSMPMVLIRNKQNIVHARVHEQTNKHKREAGDSNLRSVFSGPSKREARCVNSILQAATAKQRGRKTGGFRYCIQPTRNLQLEERRVRLNPKTTTIIVPR